ncbi:hypothetical protein SAMN05428976_10284 [Clostridium sp. USBA 49]|uniref:hypothetical protein n=1 Tax=Clostridium sp. USBA 49 TaxID=1881060 RepID=UPI00099B00D1|nr:hypothetical protein [Clostridium sp. USBA 49]SKA75227.1 hypothetical protein SAMN05428976_10284 [Clostridium sp. USBA 49]
MIKTMDKTTCRGRIVDTKLVQCRDGFMYHINRVREGVIDTVNLSYATKGGVKTVSKKIPSVLGWIGQAVLEFAIPLV